MCLLVWLIFFMVLIKMFFFFSSRRRHTRCGRDWNSDVCSSDLEPTKRILKRRVEDKKKLTIPKTVRFKAYRPVAAINNNSEENVQIQRTLFSTKNTLR